MNARSGWDSTPAEARSTLRREILEEGGEVAIELLKPLFNCGDLLGRAARLLLLEARSVFELGEVVQDAATRKEWRDGTCA